MKDFELEQKALYLLRHGGDFCEVHELIKQAISEKTKQFIHNISVSMYHREEAFCGLD